MIAAAVLVLAMTAPASALECMARPPGDGKYYSWRNVDGRRCYYRGERGLSKRWLHWPERDASRSASPRPKFRKPTAAIEPATWPVLAEPTRVLPLEDLPTTQVAEPFIARFNAAILSGQTGASAPVRIMPDPPPLPLPRPPDIPADIPAGLALLALLGLRPGRPSTLKADGRED